MVLLYNNMLTEYSMYIGNILTLYSIADFYLRITNLFMLLFRLFDFINGK